MGGRATSATRFQGSRVARGCAVANRASYARASGVVLEQARRLGTSEAEYCGSIHPPAEDLAMRGPTSGRTGMKSPGNRANEAD